MDVADLASAGSAPLGLAAHPSAPQEVAPPESATSAGLKVYQSEVEIGALFTLPGQALLCTFKLIQPLANIDRCTSENYLSLHKRQSQLLRVADRFQRRQRMHTSDGDKALDKAERAYTYQQKQAGDDSYVETLRHQCQVHRVFHVITSGLSLVAAYTSGQVRLALSLKGP